MKHVAKVSALLLLLLLVGCSGKLTIYEARIAVLRWEQKVRYNSQCRDGCSLAADEVKNNTGPMVIAGIQELPQENAARVDLVFNNFKYGFSGSEQSYTGPGVAILSRYNDGTWILRKVSFAEREWDNLNIKAE
jgi:hypothetical protein